jgi:hypothetical protein
MFSVASTPMSRRVRASVGISVLLVLSLIVVRAAFASVPYGYYVGFANPGVPHSSEGWNDRTSNLSCRDDAVNHVAGFTRVADYNGSGVKVYDTGPVWTQCQIGGKAEIAVNGYFLTRCWNSDSGGMYIYCQTTRPQ